MEVVHLDMRLTLVVKRGKEITKCVSCSTHWFFTLLLSTRTEPCCTITMLQP